MKIYRGMVFALAGLLLLSVSSVAEEDAATELMSMLGGSYRTADPESLKEGESLMWDRRQLVELTAMSTRGIYWQLNTGDEEKLYRQRLLVFENNDDGSVTQHTWYFRAPEAVADQFDNPGLFAALTQEDLKQGLPDGCEQIWRRDGDNWQGVVDPGTCRLWSKRREQWRRIGAEVRLFPDELWQVERGFDDEMNQLFGTAPGEYYVLKRIESSM
jgi:CpeT/CpcT family protein DUF1001